MSLGDKLLSRKFWLALTGAVALFCAHAYGEVAQIVIAYLAVQAGVDAFSTYQQSKQPEAPAEVPAGPEITDAGEATGWTGSTF